MPIYHCRYVDNTGKTKEMTKEASNEDVLVLELAQKGYSPIKIKEVNASEEGGGTSGRRFSQAAVLEFTETLALLLNSKLSIKDALEVSRTIFNKGPVRELTFELTDRIKKGDSFHEALSRYPKSFSPLFRGLVKIGEKIGSLEDIFPRLTQYLRDSKKVKDKLGNALTYPVMVLGFTIVGMIGMAFFIFPRIKSIFSSLGKGVSGQLDNSMQMVNVIFIIIGVIIGLAGLSFLIISILRNQKGEITKTMDRLLLKIPIIGNITSVTESMNLLFAMETLITSSFSVEDALPESAKVLKNQYMIEALDRIRKKLIKGQDLSKAFLDEDAFPEKIGRWINIGEKGGTVDKVFGQLRFFYQDEIDKLTTRFMGVIEPALIVVVGLVVLFMIMTFFVPIFSMYQDIGV
ncbi:MAG: type II secretion system F family protein [Spirochaetales bacterium]|nr:type II secretion system F family protein [Spirochaetales bacterium]